MNIGDILTPCDYNYGAIRRILTASVLLSPEQFGIPTAHSFGSLRGALVHVLDSECAWRMLCQYRTLASFDDLMEETFSTLDVLE